MKELARARIKNGKITIPPNIMERLLLQENEKVSFFEHRGTIIIRKYREGDDTAPAEESENQETHSDSSFRMEFGSGSSAKQPFPFNPLDPAFQESFRTALKDIFGNEEAQEKVKKTAEDLEKIFGNVFDSMFANTRRETINLDDLETNRETGKDADQKTTKEQKEQKKKRDDDEEEFRIEID
ncbi:MAG: hypothetical protein ACFFD4_13035 [Candidatus Odinarchaeota archaeon]